MKDKLYRGRVDKLYRNRVLIPAVRAQYVPELKKPVRASRGFAYLQIQWRWPFGLEREKVQGWARLFGIGRT